MNEEEVRHVLTLKGLEWDDFINFMRGQTVGIYEDGSTNYYRWDVERFLEND